MESVELTKIISIFWSRKWFISIVTLIFMLLGMGYTFFLTTPKYEAATTLVLSKPLNISKQQTGNQESITQNDILLNQKLVNTYGEIIKSRKIARQVINNLNLTVNEKDFIGKISVNSVRDTEVMKVSIVDENPELATNIANEIAKVFSKEIVNIYNIQNVSIVDIADVPITPFNINKKRDIAIFIIIGFMISLMIVFLMYYLDNTIKDTSDIEEIIGLNVLAVIPKIDNTQKGGKKK